MESVKAIFGGILEILVMVGSAVQVLLGILPIIFIIVIGYLVYTYREDLHYQRIAGSRILELDNLSPQKLRYLMLYLLGWLGYKEIIENEPVEDEEKKNVDRNKGYEGVDILIEKDGTRFAVLVEKRERGVGQRVFKKLENAMDKYNCEKGIIINNGEFDNPDREAAGYGDIELWGRERIMRELLALQGVEDTQNRGFTFHLRNFFSWVWYGG